MFRTNHGTEILSGNRYSGHCLYGNGPLGCSRLYEETYLNPVLLNRTRCAISTRIVQDMNKAIHAQSERNLRFAAFVNVLLCFFSNSDDNTRRRTTKRDARGSTGSRQVGCSAGRFEIINLTEAHDDDNNSVYPNRRLCLVRRWGGEMRPRRRHGISRAAHVRRSLSIRQS